jgi:hypothetical protein
VGKIHMNKGRVGEERRGKEMDRCPLTNVRSSNGQKCNTIGKDVLLHFLPNGVIIM